ncbi:DMT family transporter [Mesorhizobium sp. CU2]|uniref:DMT family transporter n=1 Tax=unclassified Mesorhizobium TaxID=325217 RepID=UPI0011267ACE|nr:MULTISPECIES: DMT family transporter [unclassified Mesorhizobium]TPN79536.1 DMT family transporter [Mesorhizobium sp. CU3]TPO20009.1 DMT family transporter [Mesorhizobium sp. CU2]
MVERQRNWSGAAPAFAFGAVGLWATNALVGKTLLAAHPVSHVQFLQFCGAALVFALIGFFSPVRPQGMKGGVALAAYAVGFIGLVGTMMLQYIAFASMPVIEANLVAYTWPLMMAAAVIVLGRPRRPWLLGLAALAGFVGVALVMSGGRSHFWSGEAWTGGGSLAGYCAAFGSALCMAFYSLAVGRLGVAPERLLLPSALVGVALTLAWCLHDGFALPAGADLVLGLYLGAGPMGLGYYCWSRAAKLDQGGRIAIVAYLTPIASTLLLALSGESLSRMAVAGAVLVIGSCLAVGIEGTEAQHHARDNG